MVCAQTLPGAMLLAEERALFGSHSWHLALVRHQAGHSLHMLLAHSEQLMMWHLGPWFSGGLGSVNFTVRLNLKCLFQPK